jgi:hypothetical protein
MKTKNQPFIIFLHIQKTGGITLQRILRRKIGSPLIKRATNLISNRNQSSEVIEMLRSKRATDRYIIGHFCYGIHRYLPQPYTYMTFLREPVSRIISLYDYSRTNPTAYYHKYARNQTLEEFALQTPLMELDNGQVRFLAGDENDYFINRTPYGQCNEELLELAKSHIDQNFSFVGLTEYFDQSALLLSKVMLWNSCFYLRRNTTKTGTKQLVSDKLKAKIAEQNSLDCQLYEYSKNILFQQLEKHKIDQKKVEKFQSNNKHFNNYISPFYNFYDLSKAWLKGESGRP